MLLTVATLEKTYASLRVPVPWIPKRAQGDPKQTTVRPPRRHSKMTLLYAGGLRRIYIYIYIYIYVYKYICIYI